MSTRHSRGSEVLLGQEHKLCTHLSHRDLMEGLPGPGEVRRARAAVTSAPAVFRPGTEQARATRVLNE